MQTKQKVLPLIELMIVICYYWYFGCCCYPQDKLSLTGLGLAVSWVKRVV